MQILQRGYDYITYVQNTNIVLSIPLKNNKG